MESLSVESVLGLIGVVILVGLAGEVGFKRTGIPSVLFLMGLGIVLGAVLGYAGASRAARAYRGPSLCKGTVAALMLWLALCRTLIYCEQSVPVLRGRVRQTGLWKLGWLNSS